MRAARIAAAVGTALAALALSPALSSAQDTRIRGFTDVTYHSDERGTSPNAFALGQFDLYVTSQLAENVSFLGETVFEYDQSFVVDVERVIVTYSPRSYFQVAVGKHHTPIGYWNTAYHHGTLLQPTIQRPLLFRFEDEGGVLPIHTTGALLFGRDISPLHLGYDLLVGNGMGSTPVSDNDPRKSVTAALKSQITSELEVGVSYYADRLASGSATLAGDTLAAPMGERIAGAFVNLAGSHAEVTAEYHRVTNRMAATGSHATDAAYAYAGYRIGAAVPYVRFDRMAFDRDDPYFAPDDVRLAIVGTRYDVAATTGLKLELQRRMPRDGRAMTELVGQVAIGF